MHSGICSDGQRLQDDTAFSMFGTGRYIRNFWLTIYKLEEGDNDECCNLWGCVSYTTDCDFHDVTTDDTINIYLYLSQKRFNSIAEVIKNQRVDVVQVRLKRVSGFYSDWSPSISTNSVKILVAADDQNLVCPENCDIVPPRLGAVGEFGLTIIQRCQLNPKQDLRSINIYKLFEEQDEIDADT